ncbi:uncharacterized protein CEXT_269141 [Caerostris extrusa]|uniref:Uncharacterized protein n=1 Tax=Caerostris extrusa TaxID=172846 RepID=A0AAV4R738_CAEEX|nr:uncharacterized protein CEXT_269141 [Caerostris extrusa]
MFMEDCFQHRAGKPLRRIPNITVANEPREIDVGVFQSALQKVKTACGHPRRAARDVSEPDTPPTGTTPGRIVPVRSIEDYLFARVQQVVQRLSETKGHFANLADAVCNDETWAIREEGQCWNGVSLGQ